MVLLQRLLALPNQSDALGEKLIGGTTHKDAQFILSFESVRNPAHYSRSM